MSRFVKFAALAVIAAANASVALAEKPTPPTASVEYADLNLSAPAGVQALLKRIDGASRKVCGQRPRFVRYGELERYVSCRHDAMDAAVRTINNPALTIAWQGGAGKAIQVAGR